MTKKELQTMRDAQITKSNEMIHKARYSLDITEQRLLLFCIAHISPYDTELPEIKFTIVDFFRVIGIQYSGNSYEKCKEVIHGLATHPAQFEYGDGMKIFPWFQYADIGHKGNITIRLNTELTPYLLQLRKNFVTFELAYTLRFKSKNSTRLYELIKSVKYNNLRKTYDYKTTPEKLRHQLGVYDYDAKTGEVIKSKYPLYADFKRYVLAKAIKEINEQTDMNVTMEEVKSGTKIAYIILHISIKDTMERIRIRDEIDRALNLAAGINPDQLYLDLP